MDYFKDYFFEKGYLLLLSFAVLAPKFTAIDNVSMRWLLVSFLSVLFLIKILLSNTKSIYGIKLFNRIILFSCLYLICTIFISNNINEAIITFFKFSIILSTLFCVLNSLSKINDPYKFIGIIFLISISLESFFALQDFILNQNSFTGISMNRNISSFSILVKLPLILYLSSKEKVKFRRIFIRVIELLAIVSIIILQSRIAIGSLFIIYILSLALSNLKKTHVLFSVIFSLISVLFLINNFNTSLNEKTLNPLNLLDDTSYNQRIRYIDNSLELFSEKPILGHGLGSWKIESLRFQDFNSDNIIIPYYVHNDFLQILVEIGLLGFIMYFSLFIIIISILIKGLKNISVFPFLLLSVIVFFIDSNLNFPIHRSQQIVPFLFIISTVLISQNLKIDRNIFSQLLSVLLIIFLLGASYASYNEHVSLSSQDKLLNDYYNNTYSLSNKEMEKINFTFPNLASNTIPISTYLARYHINNKDYKKALTLLEYASSKNRYDILTKKLFLSVSLSTGDINKSFDIAEDLFEKDNDNIIYAEIYFSLIVELNIENKFADSKILYNSTNINIHKLFFENYIKINNINKLNFTNLLNYSANKFPNESYFDELRALVN